MEAIGSISDFTAPTYSIYALLAGVEEVSTGGTMTIGSVNSLIINSGSYTNQTVTYVQNSSPTSSDVYYQINAQSFSVVESSTLSITPDLSWSASGSTSIAYTLYGAPSFVLIDSTSGTLTVSAPSVNSDTEYDFYVTSTVSGVSSPVQKLVKLTVTNCSVQNCLKCSTSTVWAFWISGYTLSSGSWVVQNNASTTTEVLTKTTVSVVGASFGIVTIMSLINSASMISLWSMIHQVQLFFLLLLTRAYIPIDIVNIIIGVKFALNFPSLISFQNLGFYNSTVGEFKFELSNQMLGLLNIQSDSSVFNISPTIIIALLMIPIHLLVVLIYKLTPTTEPEPRCRLLKRIAKWVVTKLFTLLTFGWYIRYALEMSQYSLISSVYETKMFCVSDSMRISSLVFAVCILWFCVGMILLILIMALSSYEATKGVHSKMGEVFYGVKMQKKFKFYVPVLLARRALFVTLLILLTSVESWILISILSAVQFWYMIYIMIIRPFENIKENIIEIMNEVVFFSLIISLVYLNSASNWNSTITNIYMGIIMANTLITFLILLSRHFYIIYLANMCMKIIGIIKSCAQKSQEAGINSLKSSSKQL